MWVVGGILILLGFYSLANGGGIIGIVLLIAGGIAFWHGSETKKYLDNKKK